MAIPRFYCPENIPLGVFVLPKEAAHHAARVLRLQAGDSLILFNGEGGEYLARVLDCGKSAMSVEVLRFSDVERESTLAITLVQAVVASEKMDWVLQKCVELGVDRIVPVETARCVVRLSGERAKKRAQHWQAVVVSACEQCGRNRVPEVAPLLAVADFLGNGIDGDGFLLSPGGGKLSAFPRPQKKVYLLAGPEGGLTGDEEALAQRRGFSAASLGPRILRTETAGLAAISAFQALWGDF